MILSQREQRRKTAPGFALTDLVAMTAAAAALLFILVPSYGVTRENSANMTCMGNLRLLTRASLLYAEANDGRLPGNSFDRPDPPDSWVTGWMDWAHRPDNTNATLLATGSIAPYLDRQTRVFKCPSDKFMSTAHLLRGERVRSYSMNGFVGSTAMSVVGPGWSFYTHVQQIVNITPDRLLVFADEHPDTINDRVIVLDPQLRWVDLPANYHQQGCNFSFADGHVERRRWREQATLVPVRFTFPSLRTVHSADVDHKWVRERATARR